VNSSVRRRAGVAALVAVTVVLTAGAGVTQAGAASKPAPRAACAKPAVGKVACLTRFRSAQAAVAAGSPRSRALASTPEGRVSPAGLSYPQTGYGPADIKSIYGLDTSRGAGMTVAVVDAYDNPRAEADLATFRKTWGMSACTTANKCFRKVNQRGATSYPAGDAGWGVEIDLDLQAVSAACPKCKILLVEADDENDTSLGAAENKAVALGATIVSNSWGGSEYKSVLAEGTKYYTHPGTALIFSSGDYGFTAASFPASWTKAIAVGGTSVTKTASGWAQKAWDGSGSGCSAWINKPSWQHDKNCLMRTISDISALADPDTGLAVWDSYLADYGMDPQWLVVGGTSLAAPLVAGMVGLAGNPQALGDASYLYLHRSGLKDVVGGSNGYCGGDYLCTGLAGYDAPTGWGTPYGLSSL